MMAESIARACALLLMTVLLCTASPACYAHTKSDMKASFNLQHDTATAMVTLRPSVYADESISVDYRIRVRKQGAAGTSSEGHGGRIDLVARKDVVLGPVLRFGRFAAGDKLDVELRLCRAGSRCKQAEDVLASFSSSYPDADGAGH